MAAMDDPRTWIVLTAVLLGTMPAPAVSGGVPGVVDLGVEAGFEDAFFGHYNRGRTLIAADFDLDGWIDFYVGNVGDPSFVIRNTGPDKEGVVRFELVQTLLVDEVAWGAVAIDYDDDDDNDLFITGGWVRSATSSGATTETGRSRTSRCRSV